MNFHVGRAFMLCSAALGVAVGGGGSARADDQDQGGTRGFFTPAAAFEARLLDGEFREMRRLSLPPGRYIANATAGFASSTPDFFIAECIFFLGEGMQGELSRATLGGSFGNFVTIPLTVGVTLKTPQDLLVACRGDSAVSTQPTTITAIRVDRLTLQP